MKKLFLSLAAGLMLCGTAFAADPDLVVNTTGTEVRGLAEALGVAPASQSASGQTIVLFAGSTGWQNLADDASGTKYQKIKTQLVAKGAIEVGTTGVFYVAPRFVGIGCQGGSSYVQAENTANPRTDYMVGDACAYRDKVKALSN